MSAVDASTSSICMHVSSQSCPKPATRARPHTLGGASLTALPEPCEEPTNQRVLRGARALFSRLVVGSCPLRQQSARRGVFFSPNPLNLTHRPAGTRGRVCVSCYVCQLARVPPQVVWYGDPLQGSSV